MSDKKKIKRSLIIGLGGTGAEAALYAKYKILSVYDPENHKNLPPMIKFLVFDTTNSKPYEKNNMVIKLDNNSEFVKLSVADAQSVISNQPHIKKAIPKINLSKARYINDGAGQIRSLGRLALLANFQEIKAKITSAIAQIKNWKVSGDLDSDYDASDSSVNIHIVFSTSGGTGGGLFLDIANLFRQDELLQESDRIFGYIVLPDIFEGKPFVGNVRPNCYAAFKEIDFLMDSSLDSKIVFDYGTSKAPVKRNPFDNIFLINNTNRNGISFSEMSDLTEFIGSGICVITGSIGKDSRDMWDNARGQIGDSIQGKALNYASFGISELFYDGEKLAKLCANETASKLISSYLNQTTLDPNQETDVFIDNSNIREDRDQNEVLDALLMIRPRVVPGIDVLKNVARKSEEIKTTYILNVENDTENILRSAYDELTQKKKITLQQKINEALSEANGIDFAQKFLSLLNGKMAAFQAMMTEEIIDYITKRKAHQSRYESAKEDLDKAEKKFFGKERAITEALDAYSSLIRTEGIYIMEIKRRQSAESFFSFMMNEIKFLEDNINKTGKYLHNLQEELIKEIQITKFKGREPRPFVIEISQDLINSIDTGNIDVNDFIRYCEQSNRPIYGWHNLLFDDVYKIILDYSAHHGNSKKYLETSIEHEFRKLSREKKKSIIEALDKKAVPLWQYNRGKVLETTEQYLIGVENDRESQFSDDKDYLKSILQSKFEAKLSSTGDKYRIILFKIESAAPAHAVYNFTRYREVYKNRIEEGMKYPSTALDFHIIEGWQDTLPDLFPKSENENSLLYFAIANAKPFELIKREKGKYWIYIDENKYLRTQGFDTLSDSMAREVAFKDFLEKPELQELIYKKIEEIKQKLGDETVKAGLEGQIKFLRENSTTVGGKTMVMISNEINALTEYIKTVYSKV